LKKGYRIAVAFDRAIQQQDMVWSRSQIKWSTQLPLKAAVKTQQVREERWRETTRMIALQQG
jgi:hypothetical protein